MGCGPGFCTRELGYLVGDTGSVIGVDQSEGFIYEVNQLKDRYNLPIKGICTTFDELDLPDNSLDGVFCRWALAWIPNPEDIISKIYRWLKPGGRFVAHEYFHWMTHSTMPEYPLQGFI